MIDPSGRMIGGNAWFYGWAIVVLASVVILALIAKEVIEVWECTNEDLEEAARKGLQISRGREILNCIVMPHVPHQH